MQRPIGGTDGPPGVHAEAAMRYTPTVTTLLLLVAVLTVVAASLLAPSRWFGRVERWAFWRRESVRGRVQDRRDVAYLYAGLFAAVLVVWSLLTRYPRVDAAAQAHRHYRHPHRPGRHVGRARRRCRSCLHRPYLPVEPGRPSYRSLHEGRRITWLRQDRSTARRHLRPRTADARLFD